MLFNSNVKFNGNVKFIDYTGEYPCLCVGKLTLEIDGKKYTFGKNGEFMSFWETGGSVRCGSNWNFTIETGEWQINVESLPEQFREYAYEIDQVFNENVPYGCCGGCI